MENKKCLDLAYEMLAEIDSLGDDNIVKANETLDFVLKMDEIYNSEGEADEFIRELLSNGFSVSYIDCKGKIGYEKWMEEYTSDALLLFDCLCLISTAESIGNSIKLNIQIADS